MAAAASSALILCALSAGAFASDDSKGFVEQLERLEHRLDEHERERAEIEGQIRAAEAKIHDDLASPETAMRAQKRLKADLGAQFAAWERAERGLRRAERYMPPGEAADIRNLLAAAEPKAHRAHADDMDVFQAIEADLRHLHRLVKRRARLDVELAQHDGQAAALDAERDALAEEASEPGNEEERSEELAQAERTLRNSLGLLLKNETMFDFHQLKGTLLPPVSAQIAHEFGPRKQKDSMTYVRHTGLTWKVEPGTPVDAVGPGMVVFADRFEGFGKIVIIDHGQNYHTLYAHLDEIEVDLSQRVNRGEVIGTSGKSGSFEGPKLYFELRKDGQPLDPTPWFIQR